MHSPNFKNSFPSFLNTITYDQKELSISNDTNHKYKNDVYITFMFIYMQLVYALNMKNGVIGG